jgi:hypothetical protein
MRTAALIFAASLVLALLAARWMARVFREVEAEVDSPAALPDGNTRR